MAVIETWLNQDLQKPVKVQYIDGSLFSNNGNGNRIGVELTNNGESYTVTGTVSGYAVLSDGTTVPCTGSKSGNKASILVPPAAYLPGNIFISVFVTDGTTVTTVAAVSSTVIQARTDNQVDPGSVVTDWTQTINAAMQSVETAAANLGGIVAVPYASITFPVPLGKYTYYNNNLYRCITPIASSESFTAAHWIQVRLGDDVSDLKSALDTVMEYNYTIETPTITNGKFVIGSGQFIGQLQTNENSAYTNFISVRPGSIVEVSGCWIEDNRSICGYASNNESSVVSPALAVNQGLTSTVSFNVPNTVNYIRITVHKDTVPTLKYLSFEPTFIDEINADIQELDDRVDEIYDKNVVFDTPTITNGKYVIGTGEYIGQLQSNADSAYTGYIEVIPNSKVKISDCWIEDNRSICGFNENKEVVSPALAVNQGLTSVVTLEIPSTVHYVRITSHKNVAPALEYVSFESKDVNEIRKKVDNIYAENIKFDTPTITNGKFVIGSGQFIGQLQGNEGSAYTDYIPVVPGSKIEVAGCYLESSRSICGYTDKNESDVVSPALAVNSTESTVEISIPNNVNYIRITAYANSAPTLKYVSFTPKLMNDIQDLDNRVDVLENRVGDRTVTIPVEIAYEGRYISKNNENNSAADSCFTDYVPVIPGRYFTFDRVYLDSNRAICGYSQDKTFVSPALATGTTERTITMQIPSNIYYVRITGMTGVSPIVYQHDPTYYDIVGFYNKANILLPLGSRTNVLNRKIVTLIDDDGDNSTAMAALANLCDGLGMRCSFAVVANEIENNQTHIDFCKALQSDGFHICNHTYSHSRWYGAVGDDPAFTAHECEVDLLKAIDVFESNGFHDAAKYFVYPGGSYTRQGVPEVVKKWCEAARTIAGGFADPVDSSRILLGGINITPESPFDLDFYKDQLDSYDRENRWVIYYTHCKWAALGKYDATLTENVLQYAIDSGYTPMTFNEAWNYRRALFAVQEAFGF